MWLILIGCMMIVASKRRLIKVLIIAGCLLSIAPAVHAQDIPWEHQGKWMTTGPYYWYSSYWIGYYDDTLMVKIRIRRIGDEAPDYLVDRWKNGVESIWSTDRFDVPIVFEVEWTEDYDYDKTIIVVDDEGRWTITVWYTSILWWGDAYHEEAAAHEVGHMFGLFDEFAGGGIDPETGLINTGGLMYTLDGPTLDYYYDGFLAWFYDKMAEPEPIEEPIEEPPVEEVPIIEPIEEPVTEEPIEEQPVEDEPVIEPIEEPIIEPIEEPVIEPIEEEPIEEPIGEDGPIEGPIIEEPIEEIPIIQPEPIQEELVDEPEVVEEPSQVPIQPPPPGGGGGGCFIMSLI